MKKFNATQPDGETEKNEDKRQNEIIRIQKKQNSFVMLDKGFLEDNRLSFKAKGILAYLLSKPDNWKVVVKDLINHSNEGKYAIYSGLNELKVFGYYRKVPVRNGQRIAYWESVIFECPQENKTEKTPKKYIKKKLKPMAESTSSLLPNFQYIENLEIDNQYQENRQHNNIYHNQNNFNQDLLSINQHRQTDDLHINKPTDNDSIDTINIENNFDSERLTTESNTDDIINIFDNPMNIPKTVADKIALTELINEYPNKEQEINDLYNIVCQVLTTYDTDTIRIAKQNINITTVKQTFAHLNKANFKYILDCLSKNYQINKNAKGYFLTALFNSVRTIEYYNSYDNRYAKQNEKPNKWDKWFEEKVKKGLES